MAPASWARAVISFTGFSVPRALEIWLKATSFVALQSKLLYPSISSSPASLMSTTLMMAPFSSASICQGTMLEWCSNCVRIISSPFWMFCLPHVCATRLIESVVPAVNSTSCSCSAFKKRCVVLLAFSYASVATWLRWWTPRWILAL